MDDMGCAVSELYVSLYLLPNQHNAMVGKQKLIHLRSNKSSSETTLEH